MTHFRALALFWFAFAAHAQDSRGAILGRVTDTSGAVVPRTMVRAVHLDTNTLAAATTNAEGNFELPYLISGVYRLEAEQQGFKKFVRSGIEVRVADRLAVNIVLEIGDLAETITVTAEANILETATASLGMVVDRRRIEELPLPNGNPWSLAQLAPGVSSFNPPNHYMLPGGTDAPNRLSIDGNPARSAEFTLDGAPNMTQQDVAFTPLPDIVEEFKVETANYDASSGYSPAGVINAVIKSGGNKLRGALSWFNTSGPMRGTDFFTNKFIYDPGTGPITPEKIKAGHPAQVLNRYGAAITGPVFLPKLYDGRNRTFFSYSYQGFRRSTADHGFYNVPSMAQRRGDFSELLRAGSQYQIYDPATARPAAGGRLTRQPLAGNIIPASRLDPMALGLLKYWSEPNAPGTADGLQNYGQSIVVKNEYESHLVRMDHVFSDRHRTFGRFTNSRATTDNLRVFDGFSNGRIRTLPHNALALDHVYIVSPAFLANFRASANRLEFTNARPSQGMDVTTLGFPASFAAALDPRGVAFPAIVVNGLTTLGDTGGDQTITNYYNFAATFTRMVRNHSIRFGAETRILQENGIDWGNVAPRLEFAANWTRGPLDNSPASPSGVGQGLASFLLGLPTGGRVNLNPFYAEESTYHGFFVQDDWKLTPRLTVNAGLRYEIEGPVTERYNRSVRNFDFDTANPIDGPARASYARSPIAEIDPAQFRSTGGLLFAGVGGPRELWDRPWTNFAPRIGLAWNLRRGWVVRAGYGMFYDRLGTDRRSVNLTGFSSVNTLVASPDNGITFTGALSHPFPDGLRQPEGSSGGLRTNVGQGVSFFDPHPRNPYMQRWSLAIQRSLPHRIVLEASYVGNRGTRLGSPQQLDAVPARYLSTSPVRDQAAIDFLSTRVTNPYYPLLPGTSLAANSIARSQLLPPYPHFAGITVNSPAGFSWYHALQVRTEKRFSAGYTLQASYTWSKFMEAVNYLNETDGLPEHIISNLDRPHRFVASGIWEIPIGRGRRFAGNLGALDRAIGGWQVQGIYTGQGGPPLGFGNALFYGQIKEIPLPRGHRTPDLWFNRDAGFERSAAKQLGGNIQRFPSRFSGLRAGGHNIWNLSVMKHFRLREGLRLQLRAESQNALNHPHFAVPNTSPVSSLFGVVTATDGNPRLMFVGLKLVW